MDAIVRELLLVRIHKYVSLRQSAEWGMRALQGTFTRLKSRLTSNNRMRKLIIETIVLLSNFRTAHVGLNQIATVFNPQYEQIINVDGYDRIARYFYNENNLSGYVIYLQKKSQKGSIRIYVKLGFRCPNSV